MYLYWGSILGHILCMKVHVEMKTFRKKVTLTEFMKIKSSVYVTSYDRLEVPGCSLNYSNRFYDNWIHLENHISIVTTLHANLHKSQQHLKLLHWGCNNSRANKIYSNFRVSCLLFLLLCTKMNCWVFP